MQKISPLMGYALKQALHDEPVSIGPKPYTWADVMSSQTSERNYDHMTAFKINMRDGRIYEGAITSGLRWPEASSAMLAECNRQREQAPE